MDKSEKITLTAKKIDKSLFTIILPIGMFFFIMFVINQLHKISILGMYVFMAITSSIMMICSGYWYFKLKKLQNIPK
ncbi:MAG: hypothetical protein AABY22_31370 [Nanoarchaeota archaeon]